VARSSYLSFDYEHFNEQGLKSVLSEFKRNDLPVVRVSANNKQTRQQGVPTKKAELFFTDGQRIALQAKADGAIFQVRLNNKVIPVTAVNDLKRAIAEISEKVKGNAKIFQKTLKGRLKRAQVDTTTATIARTSTKARIAMLNAGIQEQNQNLEALRESLTAAQNAAANARTLNTDLRTQLAELQAQKNTLLEAHA